MPSSTRLILALTALISGTKAWYPCYPAPLTLAQIIGEPQCLSNETAFHTFNEVYVPNYPPSDVWAIVGNFNNLTWQADTNITTTGIQNAPNDTHTQYEDGETETEELNIYVGPSSNPPTPTQTLYFMQFRLIPLAKPLEGGVFDMTEDLLIAVKNGTGTTLSWESSGCSPNATLAAGLFSELHQVNVNNTLLILQGKAPMAPA